MKNIKKITRGIIIIVGVLLGVVALGLLYLTIREYRPSAVEPVSGHTEGKVLEEGEQLKIITYNTGYSSLGSTEDFFMDGGEKVRPDNQRVVEESLLGNANLMNEQNADIYLLQEVDLKAKRSYKTNQVEYFKDKLDRGGVFAYNFKCDYVPYPLPTIGHVESGLLTLTDYEMNQSSRIALAESFTWPLKTCNLKRALLETRIPIDGTEKELVLLNLHLEAYDSGEGKIAQSKMLASILEEEYQKGNYVIAGGDFNQVFGEKKIYPILDQELWMPGIIGESDIPQNFSFAVDDSKPTCRLLNKPYSGSYEDTQLYVIDGFIVSDNIMVNQVEVIDTKFQHSDHQPVALTITLNKE